MRQASIVSLDNPTSAGRQSYTYSSHYVSKVQHQKAYVRTYVPPDRLIICPALKVFLKNTNYLQ